MSESTWTLDDALNVGQGIERPFRCPSHDDSNASASVNVLKGVWYCYACHAAGTVDGKKAPTAVQLAAMLEPEQSCRVYPDSWYELFADPGYWAGRFPAWLCWNLRLGEDPFTGDAVFPVRTPEGHLAGVGRRLAEPAEDEPRYKYPHRWSASRTLGMVDLVDHADIVGILTEGYADAAACREMGFDAFACFGSGLHFPQRELLARMNKKLWLLGFDMDEAGDRAAERAEADLVELNVARIHWPEKDPADTPPPRRVAAVHDAVKTVRPTVYRSLDRLITRWVAKQEAMAAAYAEHLEEAA